ncbi:hypothetical protein IWQ61_005883 [Dispira simplex]|nr:hypothetical protein IWQ61_005883 [Dispira simplex]
MSPAQVRSSKKARKMVIYGIPDTVRPRVWQFLAEEKLARKPGLFGQLVKKPRIPIYDVIERDVARCYPDHRLFCDGESEGQRQLDRILKAYAHYNPEVGYCQGMGRLVGVFLMYGLSTEDSFWMLVATVQNYLPGFYVPTLYQVRVDSAVFDQLLTEHNPKLAAHLTRNDITPLMYVTQWFMTLFTMTLPWPSVLRVWDWFYLKGPKILFRIGLAIMDCVSHRLLTECPTNTEILQMLLHIPKDLLEPEPLFHAANKVRITTAHIAYLTKRVTAHGIPDRGELVVQLNSHSLRYKLHKMFS